MKGDWPSRTAIAVALARAAATRDRGAPGEGLDPYARDLLPAPIARLGDALPPAAVRALTLGVTTHVELRSLAIDAVARDALAGAVKQLAIVGAGLDARALRLARGFGARTFEIDHPATQRYKRARLGDARDVAFVAVDFERDSLAERLAASGHDAGAATMWIWEGVTMYLPPQATEATLAVLRARSAAGSVLAATYATPEMAEGLGPIHGVVRLAFAALGEPLVGLVDPARFAAMLEAAGFRLVDDSGPSDWAARFPPKRPLRMPIAERLAVAHVA